MKKIIATSLFVLAAIALLGLSSASAAEVLWVIKDGVLDKNRRRPLCRHANGGGRPELGAVQNGQVGRGRLRVQGRLLLRRRPAAVA